MEVDKLYPILVSVKEARFPLRLIKFSIFVYDQFND